MDFQAHKEIAWNGIWKQNTGVVQILGLCPILAISTNVVNAVSLGLATILVMALANLAISALRNFIPYEIRIPVFILIIAALTTVVDLSFNAFFHDLYLVLGIFIPLIVTNCIVLARVEAFAAKNEPAHSTTDGIAMGVGLTLVLAVLGAMREIVGSGVPVAVAWKLPGTPTTNVVLAGDVNVGDPCAATATCGTARSTTTAALVAAKIFRAKPGRTIKPHIYTTVSHIYSINVLQTACDGK